MHFSGVGQLWINMFTATVNSEAFTIINGRVPWHLIIELNQYELTF